MSEAASYALVMNAEFIEQLHERIERATRRVYVQVMTYDGDDAGLGVTERLIAAAARGVDVRIVVDSFAFRYVSDTRSNQPAVAEEVAATHAMFDRLESSGVQVVYVNPFGRILQFGAFRNHKKIYVLDDVAYIGGINISDHNFAWLDFNVALTDTSTVEILASDFEATYRGERRSLDGPVITNDELPPLFWDLVDSAEESIVLASPYALDLVLADRLLAAPAKRKVVIAPEQNNMRLFRLSDPYIRQKLRDGGVELRSFTNFFHAKFAVFDDERALVGSSNFGVHSFTCNQELAMVIDDPAFLSQLTDVLDKTEEFTVTPSRIDYLVGRFAANYMRAGIFAYNAAFGRHAPTITTR